MDLLDYEWGLWKCLVEELVNNEEAACLSTAVQWYENEVMSKYGCLPQWSELLTCLQQEEPVTQNCELEFVPVFHTLSPGLKSTFLQLLLHFRHRIPTLELAKFTKEIASNVCTESWLDVYIRMLAAHCQLLDSDLSSESEVANGYVFTSENEKLASDVCQKYTSNHSPETSIVVLHSKDENPSKSPEVIDLIEDDDSEEPTTKKIKVSNDILKPNKISEPLDTETQADLMKLKEHWQTEYNDLPEEFSLFYTSTPSQVAEFCTFLNLESLTESAVICACQHLLTVSESISHDNNVQFLESALLPKLFDSSSRPLLNLLKRLGEKLSKPLIDGVFVHLVMSKKSGSSQTDVICKMMRNALSVTDLVYFIKKLSCTVQDLSEVQLPIFQTLFELKIPLKKKDLSQILDVLKKSATEFKRNLKFGKLVLATLNIYGGQMDREHVSTILQILQSHTSFLKKSIEMAVKKLGIH
ncbi:uncharacterized protein LOC125649834 isoform X2 [Ostrea edulis]|nr:uncharacterized protein LOC125649834 isoform X2 [Ostrea edulis]